MRLPGTGRSRMMVDPASCIMGAAGRQYARVWILDPLIIEEAVNRPYERHEFEDQLLKHVHVVTYTEGTM